MRSEIFKKIALSNINHSTKIKACADIMMMETNKDYANHTAFEFEETILFSSFAFNKSYLGFEFWNNISIELEK